jgi:hypothetical protein
MRARARSKRPCPNRGWAMSSGAVLLGLGLAGAALALYLAHHSSKQAASRKSINVPPATAVALRQPIVGAVPTAQTAAEIEALLRTAWGCVDARPLLDDVDVAHCVWKTHWPALEYPERAVPGDHASVGEALASVRAAVVAARAYQRANLPAPDVAEASGEPTREEQRLESERSVEPDPMPAVPAAPPMFPLTTQTALVPSKPDFWATMSSPLSDATAKIPVDLLARTSKQPTPGDLASNRRSLGLGLAHVLCRG